MNGSRSPYQSTTKPVIPMDFADLICRSITSGSCDEYPTEMWRGCPNHASYSAKTCGELPVARYFSCTGASAAELRHPCGKYIRRRSTLKRFSINKNLEASGEPSVAGNQGCT